MHAALRTVAAAAGATIVVGTVWSAIRSTVLPRGVNNRLSKLATVSVRVAFRVWAGRSPTYERRDRIMAMLGPVAILLLLLVWIVLLLAGYTLMYVGLATHSWRTAFELSGSSAFTLGSTSPHVLDAVALSYTEAGLGLLLVTLLITYLPSIYGAFSRREAGVALLRVRAGIPPRAVTMLIRYHRIEEKAQYRLSSLWQSWEQWFVEVEESHTTFPILAFFRSPKPDQSWITAAGALLDAASFWVAAIEHEPDPDAALCIRAGFQALQGIADQFHVAYNLDPDPDDPITVGRGEWQQAMQEMADAGVPLRADWDQVWKDWKGWRVNYDMALLNLARMVEAPPAPWLSDRSPIGGTSTPRGAVAAKTSLVATRVRRGDRAS